MESLDLAEAVKAESNSLNASFNEYRNWMSYTIPAILFSAIAWLFRRLYMRLRRNVDVGGQGPLEHFMENVIAYVVLIPMIPIILSVMIILILMRISISAYLALFYSGKRRLATSEDGFWAYERYASSSGNLGMYVVKGKLDKSKVIKRIEKVAWHQLIGDRYRVRLISFMNFPCWEVMEDEEWETKDNIFFESDEKSYTELDVFEKMCSVQDIPFSSKIPPWQIFVLPNFRYKDDEVNRNEMYAVVFRIHHAIMDGISTANVLKVALADNEFEFMIDPVTPMGIKIDHDAWSTTLFAYFGSFMGLLCTPKTGLVNIFNLDTWSNPFFMPEPLLTGPKVMRWTRPVNLEVLKKVKKLIGTSFYAILLSCLASGGRDIYARNGRHPSADIVHAVLPMALLPYRNRKPQNRFVGVISPVLIGSTGKEEVSSEQRLEFHQRAIKRLGLSYLDLMKAKYVVILGGSLPYFAQKLLFPLVDTKYCVSNIPGPKDQVNVFDGGEVIDIALWIPLRLHVGVGICMFSYKNMARITVCVDKTSMFSDSDPDYFIKSVERELVNFCHQAGISAEDLFVPIKA